MVKLGCRPICSAYSRSSLAPIAWNVPAQVSASVMMPALAPSTLAQMLSTRRLISDAARREKVISRMRRGSTPLTIKLATRWAKVLVLPDPAPAMTSSGATDRRFAADTMFDGPPLLGIQFGEVVERHL